MDRAERRQRRLEQKAARLDKLQRSEAGSWLPKAEIVKCCHCGPPKGQSATFRAGPRLNTLCDSCGLKRASKGTLRGVQNASQEDGTDGATVLEERAESSLSLKDLQAQLHLSDVREMKWQKIAAERLEENKELRNAESKWQKIAAETLEENKELRSAKLKWQKIEVELSDENKELRAEIECLNGKIKVMTEANAGHHKEFESGSGAGIQISKDRKDEVMKRLDDWVKDHSSLFSSKMEKLRQIVQNANSNMQSTHYQASQRTENADEATADVNVCTGVSSERTGNFDSHGRENEADLKVDVEQQNSGYPERQIDSVGQGCKIARQMDADSGPNECLPQAGKSVHVGKRVHDSKADSTIDIGSQSCEDNAGMASGLQTAASMENVRPAEIPSQGMSEVLFTEAERNSALALVSKEFLMWLNSRTRRPTSKEMSLHKSQVKEFDEAHWTGLSERRLLDRFHADTEMERPSCYALSTLLRSVLHVAGSSRRDDIVWCLVWADCTNLTQLPGYRNSQHDTKRARA